MSKTEDVLSLTEILYELALLLYYKVGRGNNNILLMDGVETAKAKIQELYILKSDVEAAIGEDEVVEYLPNNRLTYQGGIATDRNILRKEIRTKLNLNSKEDDE